MDMSRMIEPRVSGDIIANECATTLDTCSSNPARMPLLLHLYVRSNNFIRFAWRISKNERYTINDSNQHVSLSLAHSVALVGAITLMWRTNTGLIKLQKTNSEWWEWYRAIKTRQRLYVTICKRYSEYCFYWKRTSWHSFFFGTSAVRSILYVRDNPTEKYI